ncbi:hypothetical protein [Anoxybacteroides rupiense]|jgi:hypothetical protein|uniref:hypothetical protein n=1 Tax=Anoxybacteroides rupiense TaxID=311460 RepID=UPI0016065D14|nr:hypothetical protein [Anoxybacillus rupiensis]MBB3909373.1 hypothetical protein [Anoxybacillus rupiensis]
MSLERLIELIEIGHDIEFIYNDERYSIMNTQVGICFTKYYNLNHQEYTNVSDFIDNAWIGEEKLKDIVSQIEITHVF